MQMPIVEVSLQAQSQSCSQVFEVDDALQHHMLPWLGLFNVMQLAGTCTAWRQLIADTPMHRLSLEARQAVLPSNLISSRQLLQLVKQQAQLLARLRGKHGFTPGIQRLSFRAELLQGTQQGNTKQSRSAQVPQLCFQALHWSPCTCLEEPSRWLALDPDPYLNFGCKCLPVVIDASSGQQLCFQKDHLTMPHKIPSLQAAWLTGKSDQILIFPHHTAQMSKSIAWLAAARSQSILPVKLPGAQFQGRSDCWFFTVCGKDNAAINILCWSTQDSEYEGRSARCFRGQISVFNASSRQLLYQLSCPQQVHKWLQLEVDRHVTKFQPATSSTQLQNGALVSSQLLLSPDKKLLAIVWQYTLVLEFFKYPVVCTGVSIHSAVTGDLHCCKLLTRATSGKEHKRPPTWLPCSSNLIDVSESGRIHAMTSSGCELWGNTRADRSPDLLRNRVGDDVDIRLNASPCGRLILVMDDKARPRSGWARENCTGDILVVEASTGRTLADFHSHRSTFYLRGKWSMCGEICMLAGLDRVLVYCPQAHPMFKVFQQCELGRPDAHAMGNSCDVSLSPCGSIVIDLGGVSTVGLQHWRIPASSAIGKEAAAGSASRTCHALSLGS